MSRKGKKKVKKQHQYSYDLTTIKFRGSEMIERIDPSAERISKITGKQVLAPKCIQGMLSVISMNDVPGRFEEIAKIQGTPFEKDKQLKQSGLKF